ncbi:immune inhibitor A domain-containing protein [Thalassotalea sp. G2M2-11]|uniref:immune inhibitor A domain-containing protein n=1 Tax=Thalassotalea sp. G2M2-11 TaxID=2787627 RepID=UPI0019D19627|nr:immune inhibitor A domain-containing protein [Thalassotalea sp. G2M2-11]
MFNSKRIPLALAFMGITGAVSATNLPSNSQSGAFDMAIADEHKLIEMLKKSGKISANASLNDAEEALHQYLRTRQEHERKKAGPMDMSFAAKLKNGQANSLTQSLQNGKGNKLGKAKKSAPDNLVLESYNGEKRTAKVLAVLMEFPDFPHNSIEPGETGMYYEDYTKEHYAELLFGDEAWVAPNGHHANSMRMYYEAQSGGSYSVEGSVAGWYMAEKPAAYYGNNTDGDIRSLIREALAAAAADPNVDLSDFDIEDRYDLDGDGDYWEPDGLVDHVMVFHSSVGEEAGGGQLGEDAIWAHRWNLGSPFAIPGTTTDTDMLGLGAMGAFDYTVQPADSAVGVVSHEYGHDLGLPDEYDTQYSGRGEPVSSWSIMSSGSWAGRLGGTEPTGFSAWAKEFLQNSMGGNWLHGATVNIDDITADGVTGLLDQAVSKGMNNDAIRINLPDKETLVTTPTSGEYAYFSGSGNELFNRMIIPVDLTNATTATAKFKAWYDIETDWDYAYVYAFDSAGNFLGFLPGNITTDTNPYGQNRGNAITGNSNGWIDAEFDLSAFVGDTITLYFLYETDGYVANPGLYVDDFAVETDAGALAQANADDADNEPFYLLGYTADKGVSYSEHYYLAEWRTHQAEDAGLAHINVAGENMAFNEGLLLWYVDNKYTDNWVGIHPGDGFLGVVDADRHTNTWDDNSPASTRYQIHDATFSLDKSDKMFLDLKDRYGISMRDNFTKRNPVFDDSVQFISNDIPDAGRNIPNYGLKIRVTGQSKDKSVGRILLYK